jgi:hypothetical protein
LQRAKYHRWKNPPVTSLFTLKAEAVTLSAIIEYYILTLFVEQMCIIEANRVNNVNTIL